MLTLLFATFGFVCYLLDYVLVCRNGHLLIWESSVSPDQLEPEDPDLKSGKKKKKKEVEDEDEDLGELAEEDDESKAVVANEEEQSKTQV